MSITLASIELTDGQSSDGDGDALWINRVRQSHLIQQTRRTLAGTVVVYQEPMLEGVPITIRAFVTFAKLAQLRALRDSGSVMALATPFQNATVIFADDSGLEYSMLAKESANQHDTDSVDATMNLITVSS